MTVFHGGSFAKLIFRWRGSLWRVVYKELFIFYLLYYSISLVYRYILNQDRQKAWNAVVVEFSNYLEKIPITYLLGFYVTSMVSRYWDQFRSLAWPDDLCCWINFIIPGNDPKSRLMRRTMARYLVLTCVLSWRDVSTRIRKRFPRIDHIVATGLMTEQERKIYEQNKVSSVHWNIPVDWCQRLIEELLYDTGTLAAPNASHVMNQLNTYRAKFRLLYWFNWLSVPLTYTQVAAIATYTYFLFCLVGRQYLDPKYEIPGHQIDMYVPILTTLQFVFYIGWLKVGQYIMHPFGEDDDDFELNAILDRHIKAAFAIVDGEHRDRPPIVEDAFIHMKEPKLLHTAASIKIPDRLPTVKTGRHLRQKDQVIVYPNDDEQVVKVSRATSYRRRRSLVRTPSSRISVAVRNIVNSRCNGNTLLRSASRGFGRTLSVRVEDDDDGTHSCRSLAI